MEVSDLLWIILPLFALLDFAPAAFISAIVLIFVLAQNPDNKDIVGKITTAVEKEVQKQNKPTQDAPKEPKVVTPTNDSTEWN